MEEPLVALGWMGRLRPQGAGVVVVAGGECLLGLVLVSGRMSAWRWARVDLSGFEMGKAVLQTLALSKGWMAGSSGVMLVVRTHRTEHGDSIWLRRCKGQRRCANERAAELVRLQAEDIALVGERASDVELEEKSNSLFSLPASNRSPPRVF